jgi:hypothetical protein
MPCRDYESDSWGYDSSAEVRKLKAQADKLARIACKAMDALEEAGKEDFLLLKDDEVRKWWAEHKEADRKEQARIAEKLRRERVKEEALAKLSSEERELLGLGKSSKKKSKGSSGDLVIDIEQILEDAMDGEYDEGEIDVGGGIKVRIIK